MGRPDLKAPKSSRVGDRLKWVRARSKLTIRELSATATVPNSVITEIELGNRIPRANTLEKLANALKVSACWLTYGEGSAPDGWLDDAVAPRER